MSTSKIQIAFSKFFPPIILKNTIVATILYNISEKLSEFKSEYDNQLNTDI